MTQTPLKQANRRIAKRLLLVTFAMFAFGYALVPLYNVFCEVTGLNGKTGRLSVAQAAEAETRIDESRWVTVEFVTNVSAGMPWEFKPMVNKVKVHPGVETLAHFEAVNYAQFPVTGSAVPSVAPSAAARYFNKTECFCFTQQALNAGETRLMPVRFVVDPKLPQNVKVLTLAYTFFESVDTAANVPFTRAAPQS
jgi:cytochrome c oxidase assembly protein subunit 11